MSDKENSKSRREFITGTGAGAAAGMAVFATLLGSGTAHAQEIELNAMGPTPEQMQAFMALPSGPVCMVNLLKYKEGASAEYQEYGVQVSKILKSIGAEIIFSAECKGALIGGATWDAVAIVRYPDKTALLKMAQSPEYQKIHVHREAGLTGQINLACFENAILGSEK